MPRVEQRGFSLIEALVAVAVLGLLAHLGIGSTVRELARLRVESVTRRVVLGLERGRRAAQQRGEPCAMALGPNGWKGPAGGALPACHGADLELTEGIGSGSVQLSHNLPAAVRFTSNGLVLDGGTVLVRSEGTALVRCIVVALPLGVVRLGQHGQRGCIPDPTL